MPVESGVCVVVHCLHAPPQAESSERTLDAVAERDGGALEGDVEF